MRDLTDAELLEHAEEGWEHLSELDAEIGSEVSLFGDSWPGSADSLARTREAVAATEAEIGRRGLRDPMPLPAPNRFAAEVLRHAGHRWTAPADPMDFPRPMSHAPAPADDDIPF